MIWVIHQKAFHGSLMALSKMYSPMLFWLISLCFLETVVISYAFVAHSPEILHTNEENWSMTCMIFGEIILVLYLISMLYIRVSLIWSMLEFQFEPVICFKVW